MSAARERHRWRPLVVPNPRPNLDLPLQRTQGRYIEWANLMRRVLLLEVLACSAHLAVVTKAFDDLAIAIDLAGRSVPAQQRRMRISDISPGGHDASRRG